jgi:hypothetical protein
MKLKNVFIKKIKKIKKYYENYYIKYKSKQKIITKKKIIKSFIINI